MARSVCTAWSASGPLTRAATDAFGRSSNVPSISIPERVNDPSEAVKSPAHDIVRSPSESKSPHVQRSALNVPSTPVSWVISRGAAA